MLRLGRDVHSLEEVAGVLSSLAAKEEDRNWPEALEIYTGALDSLEEAKGPNPRYATVAAVAGNGAAAIADADARGA